MKCEGCLKDFTMGVDGVIDNDGNEVCDTCARVKRDKDGNAWFPEEEVQYREIPSRIIMVTRKEAFGE